MPRFTYEDRKAALVRLFHNNPDGEKVFEHIEEWAHEWRETYEGTNDLPAPYAWETNKIITKMAILSLLRRIRHDVDAVVNKAARKPNQREEIR